MNFLVDLLVSLTKVFGGNLGLTLIFIGVFSRVIFYPLLKSSFKHLDIQRQLKPKLDAIKAKYSQANEKLDELKKKNAKNEKKLTELNEEIAKNKQALSQEQAKVMMESGFNPVAGCLPLLVQIVVAIILFNALGHLIKSGVNTHFWVWNLAKPDTFTIAAIPFALPGILNFGYAFATLIQSKMMIPQPVGIMKNDTKSEVKKKEDFTEALSSSQGPMVWLMPLFILFIARVFPSGLALYFLVNTLTGVVVQYFISGWGGLAPWLKILKR